MKFIPVSNGEHVNAEQITRVVDRGNKIDIGLSDGTNVSIDNADYIKVLRDIIINHK